MITFCISNIKGGVAKTTTAANLAAGLHKRGFKVLMIDSDPQINLTMSFIPEPEDNFPSLYHVYSKGSLIDDIKVEVKSGLDLVVGDLELCSADLEFQKRIGWLKILSKAIKGIKTDYDFVVIDTPPNLGCLTLNAFIACDYIITPMQAESFSLKAVRLLKKTLDEIAEEKNDKTNVAGVLLTRYTDRLVIAKALESNVISSAELLNTTVFNNKIRPTKTVPESQLLKQSLFDYAPKAAVTKDYDGFITELLSRTGVK